MEIQFFTQKMELTPEIRSYVIEKMNKIVGHAGYSTSDIRGVHVDLSRNATHDKEEDLVRLEINIDFLKGQKVLRAVDRAENVQKAMDLVEAELQRQIEKATKGKKTKEIRAARLARKMLSFSPLFWRKQRREGGEEE